MPPRSREAIVRFMHSVPDPEDDALPLTFRFVMGLGIAIAIGWFAMFLLLASRW